MSNRNKVGVSVLIAIILFIVLYIERPITNRNLINTLSIIGFLLAVLGIEIAYIQILSIKEIAKETRLKVIDSIRDNNNRFLLSDLSRKAAMVDEIQAFLRDDKIELCILRMKDLKIILNTIKNQEQYSNLFQRKDFKIVFEDFNIDLDNFQQHHLNSKNKLDKGKILKNLDSLATLLLSLEVKLKSQ